MYETVCFGAVYFWGFVSALHPIQWQRQWAVFKELHFSPVLIVLARLHDLHLYSVIMHIALHNWGKCSVQSDAVSSVQCVVKNENVHCAARGARVHYSVATSGQ